MHLKGCLHTHTTCSDGELSPQETANVYSDLGYDFIAFTDHDHLWRPGQKEMYASVRSDLILFCGVELTVFERGYIHLNRIEGDTEQLFVLNHLGAYDLTLPQILERIEAAARRYPLHAVEITDKGRLSEEFDVDAIPYPKIVSDDSHGRAGCGRAWIELDCKPEKDSILRAVKRGEFHNCRA